MSQMIRPALARRRVALAAVLAAASALSAATASPALAGSYEQVSRDTGADGWSRFTGQYAPVLASDSGRYGIYRYSENLFPGKFKSYFLIRGIVANTSRKLADERLIQVFGIDKNETTILALRRTTLNASELVTINVVTGTVRSLVQLAEGESIYAALSGNGRTAAFSGYAGGLSTVDTVTGKVTKIADGRYPVGPRSLSDDGRILATDGTPEGTPGGSYFVNGRRTATAGSTVVSENGAVAISFTSNSFVADSQIVVRRVSTGAEKRFSPPAGLISGGLSWIAPGGGGLIISPSDTGETQPAQRLDFATGQWTPLTGPYANAFDLVNLLEYDYGQNPISRNGKFAVLGYSPIGIISPKQAALVDLSGGDLPGAQEPLSASSYLGVGPVLTTCGSTGTLNVTFSRPTEWAPAPRRAELTVTFNGNTAGSVKKTWTAPGDRFDLTGIPIPAGTKWATLRGNVTDATGRYLSTAETLEVPCFESTEW